MNNEHYILDENGVPKAEPDLLKWGEFMTTVDPHVADETIGELRISTVFLGWDHNFAFDGSPVLWETMVFHNGEYVDMERCSGFREQAQAMHERMVQKVKLGKLSVDQQNP